jgi:hypothetical protein
MFCTGCGSKLEENALFCRECGKKVEASVKVNNAGEAGGEKAIRRRTGFRTGFYLTALAFSVLLILYFFLWKNFYYNKIQILNPVFLTSHFKYMATAVLVLLSSLLVKFTRVPAVITLIFTAASPYVYFNFEIGNVRLITWDMFVNIWSIAALAAAIFFILTILCKGIAGRIMNVILLSLSVFLTIYSFILGVYRRVAEGYVFTRIASIGDPQRLPYYYPIVFLTYTVISAGMLSMKYAPQKNAPDTDEKKSRRKKYVLSYMAGYVLAGLMSAAVIIYFVGDNTPEKRFARIMEQGDEYYFGKYYLMAFYRYQSAARLDSDDPDVYIAMLKASGKCLNSEEFLNSYNMAVENLSRRDLKNVSEKAWKILGDMEDDYMESGQSADFWSLVNDFKQKVIAADVEINMSWSRPWGYTSGDTPTVAAAEPAVPVEGDPVTPHILPSVVEAEPVHDSTSAAAADDTNLINSYFRVDPVSRFFSMDTSLFGMSFSEMSELLGGLETPEYWEYWGADLYVTFLSDGINEYALFFQDNAFVCCYYDIPEDGFKPDDITTSAVNYLGKECDSITNPYGDGVTYFYNWIMPGYYYEQYTESYFNETHFRQRYGIIQIYYM